MITSLFAPRVSGSRFILPGASPVMQAAVARVVQRLGPRAANVHFEDQITDGRVSFDYRLRPGVVLMDLPGIDAPSDKARRDTEEEHGREHKRFRDG